VDVPSILSACLPATWAEPLTLLAMLLCFGALVLLARWPIGISLLVSAWFGAALNGHLFPAHHLVEGAFAYLDPILMIGAAMIFMRCLADGGALATMGAAVERRFGRRPVALLPLVMLIAMFPGMMTGSSTAAVLTAGAMCGSILVGLGLDRERAAAFVAMAGVLGDVAPPISIPAMIIGGGLDLPYVGFFVPLAVVAFPPALVLAYWLGRPLLRGRPTGGGEAGPERRIPLWRAVTPVLAVAVLMVAPRIAPQVIGDPGLPLIFLLASGLAFVILPRFGLRDAALSGVQQVLPVLGILVGVGAFIQVMTLTGARGWLLSLMLGVPTWAMVAAAGISIPLFGAVSAYGSASVLGVPFLIAFLGRNEIMTTAALAGLASLGDLMLPAALAATLAAQVLGVENRLRVLRRCIAPALLVVAWAVLLLATATVVGRWLT
jgi:GntP family gluconate:H+ symporter